MYGEYDKSLAPKWFLTLVHLASIVAVGWLLFGGGLETVSGWLGRAWPPGDFARRGLLFAGAAVYFARVCLTLFYLIRRRTGWGEAVTIAVWIPFIEILFAVLGGRNPSPPGLIGGLGVILYLAGSYVNTASEYQRHIWKQDPANRGRLYTGGLFRYSMHINYFGDTVLFTGYALFTGSWWALLVPLLMLAGFVFVNIPLLDAYLKKKYGSAFDEYASRTKKFIPFVY